MSHIVFISETHVKIYRDDVDEKLYDGPTEELQRWLDDKSWLKDQDYMFYSDYGSVVEAKWMYWLVFSDSQKAMIFKLTWSGM